jgi:hypothetical protein
MKRFKAESQGSLKRIWNVLDTKTSVFKRFGIAGKDAKIVATQLAEKLNNDKRYKQI